VKHLGTYCKNIPVGFIEYCHQVLPENLPEITPKPTSNNLVVVVVVLIAAAVIGACFITLQVRLNGLMSYESRVQQISADASEEISRLESAKKLEEKLRTLNRLWADTARKLGRLHSIATCWSYFYFSDMIVFDMIHVYARKLAIKLRIRSAM